MLKLQQKKEKSKKMDEIKLLLQYENRKNKTTATKFSDILHSALDKAYK
jgi:hypothetical protein